MKAQNILLIFALLISLPIDAQNRFLDVSKDIARSHNDSNLNLTELHSDQNSNSRTSRYYKFQNMTVTTEEYSFLSSTDSIPIQKDYRTYDEMGRERYSIFYDWSESEKDWIASEKVVEEYDEFGNRTIEVKHKWDLLTGSWVMMEKFEDEFKGPDERIYSYTWRRNEDKTISESKIEFEFDAFGNEISKDTYLRNSKTDGWLKVYDLDRRTDEFGNILQVEWYVLWGYWSDGNLTDWWGKARIDFAYDADGKKIQEIHFRWSDTLMVWEANRKMNFTYDSSDDESIIISSWESELNDWEISHKVQYITNENGFRNSVTYILDIDTDLWVPNYKYEYVSEEEQTQYYWDVDQNVWVGSQKWVLLHTETGEFLFGAWYVRDSLSNEWSIRSSQKRDNFYNDLQQLDSCIYYEWNTELLEYQIIWQRKYKYDFEGKILEEPYYEWNTPVDNWKLISKIFYQLREGMVTSTSQQSKIETVVFPNPVETYLYLAPLDQPALLNIISLQGNSLFQKTVFNETIDLRFLSPGTYLVIIKLEDETTISRKIVKR